MLHAIVRFCVERRVVVIVVTAMVAAFGVHAYLRTPIEAFPDVTNPDVTVIAQLPGLAPEEIERQLTVPLERVLNGVPGSIELRSESLFGLSLVFIIFYEDVDTFRIHLPAGGRISAVVEAVRLDQQMLDPHLELLDAEGFVVAACDDHPLLAQDAAIAVTVEREGDYFLRVRETAYGGGNGVYLLHVGDFPIPHVAWPPGGPQGATLDVEWIGDPAGPFRQQVILPAAELDGLARVRPVRGGGEQPSPLAVPFRVTAAPVATVAEPSNEPAAAARATAPRPPAPQPHRPAGEIARCAP
jgi:hypothetical protein